MERRGWRIIWPADTHLPTIAGDWRSLEDGRIEADYTAAEMALVLACVGCDFTSEQITFEFGHGVVALRPLVTELHAQSVDAAPAMPMPIVHPDTTEDTSEGSTSPVPTERPSAFAAPS